MPEMETIDLDRLVYEGAVKLEITRGVPTWEAYPSIIHQETIDLIRASIEPGIGGATECGCFHYSDIYIQFMDGSIKRPDISIFCQRPPRQEESLTTIPQTVIEIISPGYKFKDLALNPPFYLEQNVEDVVIVDPRTGAVSHFSLRSDTVEYQAPVTLTLQCGYRCTIPAPLPLEGGAGA